MKRQEPPPTALRQAVPFDTLSVRVYDQVRQSSPMLSRGQAQYVLAAVLRHLYRASGGHLATAEVSLDGEHTEVGAMLLGPLPLPRESLDTNG